MTINRRDLLFRGAAGGATFAVATLAGSGLVGAAPTEKASSKVKPLRRGPGKHTAVPLPFKATALTGISEKMITSHHSKNYSGAVKNLNKVEVELAGLSNDAPGFVVSGLREKELQFFNSKVLHEHYFGNLGGDGKRSGVLDARLSAELGAAWETQFRSAGAGLGGGSGWVVLAMSLHDGGLRIAQSTSHTQALALGAPLLVLDMYEHAYALDHGADFATYIDAFFNNLDWEIVDDRYGRALKARAALS
jgi:superoxide dismutase, Fe-Mn family